MTGSECYAVVDQFSISDNSDTFLLNCVHVSAHVSPACPGIFTDSCIVLNANAGPVSTA